MTIGTILYEAKFKYDFARMKFVLMNHAEIDLTFWTSKSTKWLRNLSSYKKYYKTAINYYKAAINVYSKLL